MGDGNIGFPFVVVVGSDVHRDTDVPKRKQYQTDNANSGGWGGIRTHETLAGLPVFKTGAFNRSATHPKQAINAPAVGPVQGGSEAAAERHARKVSHARSTSGSSAPLVRFRTGPVRAEVLTLITARAITPRPPRGRKRR
jgi:hypothetical protein